NGGLQCALEIEEVKLACRLRATGFRAAAGSCQRQRFTFERQDAALNCNKDPAELEQTNVATPMINVVLDRFQQAGYQGPSHLRSAFNNRIRDSHRCRGLILAE